jgi:hypothetical protein
MLNENPTCVLPPIQRFMSLLSDTICTRNSGDSQIETMIFYAK